MKTINFFSRPRRQKGATAVEFGLISIPFFLIFLGLMEVCLIILKSVLAENSIRVASREAIIGGAGGNPDPNTIEAIVRARTFGLINFEQNAILGESFVTAFPSATIGGIPLVVPGDNLGFNPGGSEEYVIYSIHYQHIFITPLGWLMEAAAQAATGQPEREGLYLVTSIIVRNEPF
jgi:hypothetical protein